MSAAPKVQPVEPEILTWDEICVRYPDQDVCLTDFEGIERQGNRHVFKAARVQDCRGLPAPCPNQKYHYFTGMEFVRIPGSLSLFRVR